MKLKTLQEEIAEITRCQNELVERSESSGVPMTDDEIKQFDSWDEEKSQKKQEYETETRKANLRAQKSLTPDVSYSPRRELVTERDRNLAEKGWILFQAGKSDLATNEMKQAMERCGTNIHNKELVLRAQTIGTPSEGGYLRQPNPVAPVEKLLNSIVGIRNYATIWTTPNTNTQNYPFIDFTSRKAVSRNENQAVTGTSISLSNKTINVKKKASAIFEISYESVLDSNGTILDLGRDALQYSLGHYEAEATCIGDGVTDETGDFAEMYGFTDATTGFIDYDGDIAVSNDLSYSELWKHHYSLPSPYRNSPTCVYAGHPSTLAHLLGKTDLNGRPLVQPNWQDGPSMRLLGKPFVEIDFMPEMAAGNPALVLADFRHFVIREVTDGTRFKLSEEKYWDQDALAAAIWKFIGCKVTNRYAGRIIRMPE